MRNKYLKQYIWENYKNQITDFTDQQRKNDIKKKEPNTRFYMYIYHRRSSRGKGSEYDRWFPTMYVLYSVIRYPRIIFCSISPYLIIPLDSNISIKKSHYLPLQHAPVLAKNQKLWEILH